MRYGDFLTITREGIIGTSQEFESIGIYPGSMCWAVCFPDRLGQSAGLKRSELAPPHLIVSSVDPQSWPALFQIDLRLSFDLPKKNLARSAALVHAAGAVSDAEINVLTYDCTPSGHHHLTWSLLGEWERFTRGPNAIRLPRISADARHFGNDRINKFVNKTLAPEMLGKCRDIVELLERRDKEPRVSFLHPGFARITAKGRRPDLPFGGQLYNVARLPKRVKSVGTEQSIKAVSCRWNQGLAFFWVFSEIDTAFAFVFDSKTSTLRAYPKNGSRADIQFRA